MKTMSYWSLRRSRVLLGSFLLFALLISVFPALDLQISGLFFDGTKRFTPPFIVSQECSTNCSFSSGDAAGAFIFIALAKALTHRRRYHAAAIAFGVLVSFARISTGAHFFSDTIVSFFVMLFVADFLWYYIVLAPGGP